MSQQKRITIRQHDREASMQKAYRSLATSMWLMVLMLLWRERSTNHIPNPHVQRRFEMCDRFPFWSTFSTYLTTRTCAFEGLRHPSVVIVEMMSCVECL